MEAVAHDPAFARKAGIPQAVGREFVQADKRNPKYKHAVGHALQHTPSQ